jgi:carbon-monoxide dehydrogenase medium subunit
VLVDIAGIDELRRITERDGEIQVGAAATQSEFEDHPLISKVPLLNDVLPHVAHRGIRNAGTVVGNLAHGDPASELAMVAVSLEARFDIAGPDGVRTAPASAMYRGYLETAVEDDEVIVSVRFPTTDQRSGITVWGFSEHASRHGDFATAGAGVVVTADSAGAIVHLRVGALGVTDCPTAIDASAVAGPTIDEIDADSVVELANSSLRPKDDIHATASYRRHLFGVAVRRSLAQAMDRYVSQKAAIG